MTPPTDSSLRGHLRLIVGELPLGLPLARVVRVALAADERRLAPRPGSEAWWRGLALPERRGIPIIGLDVLLGLPQAPGSTLVYCRLGGGQIALECDGVRGIVPADTVADPLSAACGPACGVIFTRVLRTPGSPVLEFSPEGLFSSHRRQTLRQLIAEAEPALARLATTDGGPAAAPNRSDPRQPGPEKVALGAGTFNPRVFVELLQILHLGGTSGELRVAAAGGMAARVIFSGGQITGAEASGAGPGEATLHHLLGLPAGRYEFTPGEIARRGPGPVADTAGAIAKLAGSFA